MTPFPIPCRASDGDYDEPLFAAATLAAAHARACDDLAGTRWTPEPLPTTCKVRLALRKVRAASDGVRGAAALWDAEDQLCRDPDPARMWLENRERYARDLADHLEALSKAAIAALTIIAGQLRTRDQLELSVAHEAAADRRETFRAAIARATL